MQTRRYDIDWLRTLAFGILILYHVGMYYVLDWGWHIKSDHQFAWLQDVMVLVNQWRMSLLFFISAMAMALIRKRYSGMKIFSMRTRRLMLPLLFGMAVIVPPQLYYELVYSIGYQQSYWQFLHEYFNLHTTLAPHKQSAIGLLTWNHLWFLPYLWVYTIILVLTAGLWERLAIHVGNLPGGIVLALLIVLMATVWFALRARYPVTHALLDDWYNHGKYFLAFIAGYMLPCMPDLWDRLVANRRRFFYLAMAGYIWLWFDRHGYLDVGDALDALWYIRYTAGLLLSTNYWAWLLVVVAYAGRYLQFDHPVLRYMNPAILPFYALHQTVIIVLAVALLSLQLPAWIEGPVIITLTCVICVLGYAVIRRVSVLRWLSGMTVSKTLIQKPVSGLLSSELVKEAR